MEIKRDAFLYMDPKGPDPKNHAQCGTCNMFMPKEKRCMILEKDLEVQAQDSCGIYVPGVPMEHHTLSGAEAGFIKGVAVRCENCEYFSPGDSMCELFHKLNDEMDEDFELECYVHPKGCCNAFIQAKPSIENLRKKGEMMSKEYEQEHREKEKEYTPAKG